MTKRAEGRRLQIEARNLLQQSKLYLHTAMLQDDDALKAEALQTASVLAKRAKAKSNEAAAKVGKA